MIKLQKAALERNEIVRAHYLATIGEHYTRNQLIFLNESAKDDRSLSDCMDIHLETRQLKKK